MKLSMVDAQWSNGGKWRADVSDGEDPRCCPVRGDGRNDGGWWGIRIRGGGGQ